MKILEMNSIFLYYKMKILTGKNRGVYIIERDPIIYVHAGASHDKTEYWDHWEFYGMCLIDR